jgi:hypothetical protein
LIDLMLFFGAIDLKHQGCKHKIIYSVAVAEFFRKPRTPRAIFSAKRIGCERLAQIYCIR